MAGAHNMIQGRIPACAGMTDQKSADSPVHRSEDKNSRSAAAESRGSEAELETEIYGAANSAVKVIVSPARPSWEPTGATLSSLASGGPPPVTVRV